MAKNAFERVAAELKLKQDKPKQNAFERVAAQNQASQQDRSLTSAFQRGFGSGVTGLIGGAQPAPAPEDEGWLEYLASITGGLVSDVPAFYAGGQAGALAGGALGSAIPGAGTAGGAALGGTIGAFTLPAFIKSSFGEYRDFAQKGGNLTFGDFLERSGRVAKETGKSGIIGAAMAGAGRFLPLMKRMPKLNKLLNTRLKTGVAEAGLEVGALTGTKAVLEGKLPSAKEVVGDVFTVGALKGVQKGREAFGRYKRAPLVEPKAKTPEVESRFKKFVKDIIPIDWEKRAEAKVKRARFEPLLKDYLGSKNAKIVESSFKWQENQAKYEKKGGKFTAKQHEDMRSYAQKTGNPKHGMEDSFTDVSKRLPEHAKAFMDEVVRPHLKESLKIWNENQATKNITPREGLEEYYLPGVYKNATKAKVRALEHKIKTKFRIKNPFSNQKTFMTYNEAAIEGGLEPRFNNIVDLMKHFDNVNIKTMLNAELLDMVKKFQTHNNEQIIVTSNKPREYAKAEEKGYVPFEDPFLRSFKSKEGKFETTEKPALVDPEFAKTFSGVFSKEGFKPDSKFWQIADKIKNQINFMRVAASPFHYVAEAESILGQRGLKGLRFKDMANKGRALRQNKEFMVDSARHGLKITNRLGVESLKKGNNLLEQGLDLIIQSEKTPALAKKGLAKVKRGMTYLFDEFIPNAKAVSYEEAVTNQTAKFKKEHGRAPNPQESKAMKRAIAEHLNNIFGGQNWEESRIFRDPKMRKLLRRTFAFPDWTISALKQALSVGKKGLPGNLARKYMAKYLLYTGGIAAFLRTLMGGLEQTDEKNKSVKGIRWNPKKGAAALGDIKNAKDYFSFTLPDLPIKYGEKEDQVLNMGRDDKGVRMQGHFGKQLLEVKGWSDFPRGTITTAFNKSTPLFTIPFKQAFGISPTPKGVFHVDRGFFRGRPASFQGKKGWEQVKRRALVFAEEFAPFGMRGGAKKWIASIGGAFPIGKKYTLFKAEDDIESALRIKDRKARNEKLWGIKSLLKANNFPDDKIKARIGVVRNQMVKDGLLPAKFSLKGSEPLMAKLIKANDVQGLNELKKDLIEDGGYTSRGVNSRISSVRKRLKK